MELLSCYVIMLFRIIIETAFSIILIIHLVVLLLGDYVFTLFNYDIRVFVLKFFERVLGVESRPRKFVPPQPVLGSQHRLVGTLPAADICFIHSTCTICQ